MIYLYGLLAPDAALNQLDSLELNGVTGPVFLHHAGVGYLIHGPAPDGDILPKRRLLLAHTRVLEACNAVGTVLPMRFGMSAPGLGALEAMLARDAQAIAASFERLEGAVEYGLKISFDRSAALDATLAENRALQQERERLARRKPAPHFEAAEFGRRLAEALDTRRGVAQKAALAALRPHLRDHVLRAPEEDTQILALDVLIPRGAEADLTELTQEIALNSAFAPGIEPQIRLVGPVPAYSFVRLTLTADASEAA